MKIERAWLRIIVCMLAGGFAGFGMYAWFMTYAPFSKGWYVTPVVFFPSIFLTGPIVATVLANMLTPKERLDGETRCRKCGYILKGLTEPRCSECGERI